MKAGFKIALPHSDSAADRRTLCLKILLLVYLTVIAFPFRLSPITPGIDPSWIYAVNHFFDQGIIFGRDIVWTYGPLGFLSYPLHVGSNLGIATAFQVSLWIVFSVLMFFFIGKRYFPLRNLSVFTVLFACGYTLYTAGYIGFDYCISFLFLLFLSLSFFSERWLVFYLAALSLMTLLIFIKFSAAILSLTALMVYVSVSFFIDRRKARTAALLALLVPVLFVLIYLIYHPSPRSLILYLNGAYELTSGYSAAMSKAGDSSELVLALVVGLLYAFVMFTLYRAREASFFISVICAGPFLFSFKHGFVRQDSHVMIFFSSALLLFGIIFLFTDIRKFLKRTALLTVMLSGIWFSVFTKHASPVFILTGLSGLFSLGGMEAVVRYDDTKAFLVERSEENLEPVTLSDTLLDALGEERTGIFPWEVSYRAANAFNYVPFPVFQADNAYTSYLDTLNGEFLEDNGRAPTFILMEWKAVDDRHPLVDVPAVWLALYKWYDVDVWEDSLLLLKRRVTPRFTELLSIDKRIYRTGETIDLPDTSQPVIVKIFTNLTVRGKLSKLSFRIPGMEISLLKASGKTANYRIVPDTLQDGLLVNVIPSELSGVEALLSRNISTEKVKSFRIHGRGAVFYGETMTVEFYTIPDITIGQSAHNEFSSTLNTPS